jgi:hypothetical protein
LKLDRSHLPKAVDEAPAERQDVGGVSHVHLRATEYIALDALDRMEVDDDAAMNLGMCRRRKSESASSVRRAALPADEASPSWGEAPVPVRSASV